MKKNNVSRVGSEKQYGPRLADEILHDYLENSNDAFAVAYREHKAEDDAESERLFRDFYPHTELGIDLKLITRKPGRMHVGDSIYCELTRDGDYHYIAVENALKRKVTEQRNPIVFCGLRINVHRQSDGNLYPTFNRPRYSKDFSFEDFCIQAAQELLTIARFLGEEESVE